MKELLPGSSVPFSLPAHAALPEARRPVFAARYLTAREQSVSNELLAAALQLEQDYQQKQRLMRSADDSTREIDARAARDAEEALYDAVAKLIGHALAGWSNVTARNDRGETVLLTFDKTGLDRLPDALAYEHIWEIFFQARAAVTFSEDDQKKSDCPSASAGASTAPTVDPAPAADTPASTNPRRRTPR
jgi:hypothetical protein